MPPLEKPKPDPPAPLERYPFAIRFSAATWTELIATGWGSVGFSGEAGVRYRAVSLGVEAHGDPSLGSVQFEHVGAVSFARVSGALLLCGHFGWFAGCGVGDVGRFFFPNHVAALPTSTSYAAAGVRLKLEFPVASPRLFLGAALDLRAPIHPASFADKMSHTSFFDAAGPSVGLGLSLLFELAP